MSGSHIAGNRNSTPEIGSSSLRPPSSRTAIGAGHGLRASGDIASLTQSTLAHRGIRPASEVYLSHLQNGNSEEVSRYAGEWLSEIEQQEVALEDMAAATLEPNFKDELGAIKQWFSVLSEAERTATLYILHQNTTEVQDRFFIRFLNEKCKAHPYSGVISPANFGEKDPMSQRLSDAMGKMNVGGSRNSIAGGIKRNSVLAPETIKAMFPDAVKAIESNKADFTQATGIAPSNRNSTVGERASMVAPSINAPDDAQKETASQQPPLSPWGPRSGNAPQSNADRPKSSSGHQPMGQFIQPPPSAGLRSPRPLTLSGDSNTATTTLNAPDQNAMPGGAAMLSPYAGSGNWASMVNTPMVPNFSAQQSANQADMVANATAMKLAALSTVNNRIQLDDVRKYRRARSSEGNGNNGPNGMQGNGVPNANFIMTNELGQVLTPQQAAALQAQQLAALNGRRSRPSSPGLAMQGGGAMGAFGVASPQNNGFLAAYDGVNPLANNLAGMSLNQFGLAVPGHEGYVSDHGEINRGRSPRGRRASSKAPEDPTNPDLLQDIPSWLRSLRLHKYTDNLKDLKWNELVELDDEALEKRGVNALGARRKMLKVFEQVKEAQTEGKV